MKRKFMFVAILLLALVTLGCASAADEIQADDIGAIDDVQSDVSISEDSASEDIFTDGDSGTGSLSDLKNDIENAGTTQYDLSRDYSYDANVDEGYWMNTSYMDIDNFVLDGKGHTINGGSETWIFSFEFGKNITLKNINFVNGSSAVKVNGEYPINIINCNFTACSDSAIYDSGSSIIESCNFFNNTDSIKGAAIYSNSNTTINNCYFQKNKVTAKQKGYGGAIYLAGSSPLVTGCMFYYNEIENKAEFSGGGAIYVSENANNARIVDCIFQNNFGYEGGAINIKDNAIIDSCQFYANFAPGFGGAVYSDSAVSIKNSTFERNVATYRGGAVYSYGLSLTDSSLSENMAGESGGALDVNYASIANSSFILNNASEGGGVWCLDALNLDGVNFTQNIGDSGNNIHISPGYTRITIKNVNTGYEIIASNVSYSINSGGNYTVTVNDNDGNPLAGENVTFAVGNKTIDSGLTDQNGVLTINFTPNVLKDLKAGTHDLHIFLGNLYQDKFVKLTINKDDAVITAKAASFVINYAGKYSVTIRNSAGKVLSGQKLIFVLNGKNIGSATTNAKGVATISLSAKVLKAAKYGTKNLVIKLDSPIYTSASKTVKVTIKKEKTSIVAAKKSFKKSLKVKKYTITLKNSKGKIIKKAKLTLRVKGKTFKATTNSKGKATFKITNLKKKGKFTASIKFKTTAYYLKSSKSVKLTIK